MNPKKATAEDTRQSIMARPEHPDFMPVVFRCPA
jgi:hypothetical protein